MSHSRSAGSLSVPSSPPSQTALASKAHWLVPNALTGAIPLRTTSTQNLTLWITGASFSRKRH